MIVGSDLSTVKKASEAIRNGEIVVFPTETVYGLGANAFDPEAVKKIFTAKGRPADNPLIVHISDIKMLADVCCPNEKAYALAKKFWPGPLTMILPKKASVPDIVTAGLDSVAVRFPSHKTAKKLISLSGCPIAAPSANKSGKPSPTMVSHILEDYSEDDGISVVIDGGQCKCGLESTIISLVNEPAVVLRPGFVTVEQIRKIIPDVTVADAVKNKPDENQKPLSPGLVHRHYAPRAFTVGVLGSSEKAAAYINKEIMLSGKKSGVMCFDGEEGLFLSEATVLRYGQKDDSKKKAGSLFKILRELDRLDLDVIYVRLSDEKGVDLAVYNRLIRTCGFNTVDADKLPCVVGITGKSGSGKTLISERLEKEGFCHIDTDAISRKTLDYGKDELCKVFGDDIVGEDGRIDRKKLASVAFTSENNRRALSEITHKYIMREVVSVLDKNEKNGVKSIIDGAVLVEAQADKLCMLLVEVKADYEVRKDRIIRRDGIDEENAIKRLNIQTYEIDSDYVFRNNDMKEFEKSFSELLQILKGE